MFYVLAVLWEILPLKPQYTLYIEFLSIFFLLF